MRYEIKMTQLPPSDKDPPGMSQFSLSIYSRMSGQFAYSKLIAPTELLVDIQTCPEQALRAASFLAHGISDRIVGPDDFEFIILELDQYRNRDDDEILCMFHIRPHDSKYFAVWSWPEQYSLRELMEMGKSDLRRIQLGQIAHSSRPGQVSAAPKPKF